MTPTKPEDALVERLTENARDMAAGGYPLYARSLTEAADAITTLLERERRKDEALTKIAKAEGWVTRTGEKVCLAVETRHIARAALNPEGVLPD